MIEIRTDDLERWLDTVVQGGIDDMNAGMDEMRSKLARIERMLVLLAWNTPGIEEPMINDAMDSRDWIKEMP